MQTNRPRNDLTSQESHPSPLLATNVKQARRGDRDTGRAWCWCCKGGGIPWHMIRQMHSALHKERV